MMTTYRVQIWREVKNGRPSFGWRNEKEIFSVLLDENEIDLKKVMQTIVSGKSIVDRD